MPSLRKDAQENKQLIEQKASELFKLHGVETVSMNQIAKSLNIGMGTLYRHFSDKSVLCSQLIANDFDTLFKQFEEMKTESHAEQLKDGLTVFLDFKHQHAELLACVENNKNRQSFKESTAYQQLFEFFYPLIQTGDQKADTFRTDMLLNNLSTDAYHYQTRTRQLTHVEIIEQLIKIYAQEAIS